MSYSIEELRSIPRDELIARHDSAAKNTSVGVKYYLEELARRDAAERGAEVVELSRRLAQQTAEMVELNRRMAEGTAEMTALTGRVTFLTVIAVALAAANLIVFFVD